MVFKNTSVGNGALIVSSIFTLMFAEILPTDIDRQIDYSFAISVSSASFSDTVQMAQNSITGDTYKKPNFRQSGYVESDS